jgi:hypothetical protein
MKNNFINRVIVLLVVLNLFLTGATWFLLQPRYPPLPQIFLQLPYQPANIILDAASNLGPIKPVWLAFSQGGEEMDGMLEPTVSKMKALRPKYIRIDHIFDDDYYGVVSGGLANLDWRKLDLEVEAILATGAKPFFSLGYMPKALASGKTEAPRNWGEWSELVRATVEHYSGKNAKNLSGVYYEVWNEPDLKLFGGWSRSGEKNYLALYEASVRGAMAARSVNPFYIGGPATTGMYPEWLKDLYHFCSAKQLRLDFLSWHRYAFNPHQYVADVMSLYNEFAGRPLPKLVISEWGPTPEKSIIYHSELAAVHTFATVRELIDQVDLVLAFEIKDGPNQGKSGWGILSHEEAGLTAKPRYWAFSWLAQVKGQRLSLTGEGSQVRGWATKEDEGKINLWLVNFGEGAALEGVPVTIQNLANGQWRLTKEILFGTKSQLEILITNGVFMTNFELAPNQVGRLILKRK